MEWEYLVLPRKSVETSAVDLSHDLVPIGAEGWELVTVWPVDSGLGDQFIFKRQRTTGQRPPESAR